ncbi:hypothetical protein [Clostridium sp.]|uniref:hypothetical protein n=1 Tax=Clostridium sp. TaxID=1506 RepID=UPI0032167C34
MHVIKLSYRCYKWFFSIPTVADNTLSSLATLSTISAAKAILLLDLSYNLYCRGVFIYRRLSLNKTGIAIASETKQ